MATNPCQCGKVSTIAQPDDHCDITGDGKLSPKCIEKAGLCTAMTGDSTVCTAVGSCACGPAKIETTELCLVSSTASASEKIVPCTGVSSEPNKCVCGDGNVVTEISTECVLPVTPVQCTNGIVEDAACKCGTSNAIA